MASRVIFHCIPVMVQKLCERKDQFLSDVESSMSKIQQQYMDESKMGEVLQHVDALDRFFQQPIPGLDDSEENNEQAGISPEILQSCTQKLQERKGTSTKEFSNIQKLDFPGLESTIHDWTSVSEEQSMEPRYIKEMKLAILTLTDKMQNNLATIENIQSELSVLQNTQSSQGSCLEKVELEQAGRYDKLKQVETTVRESIDALQAEMTSHLEPLKQDVKNLNGKISEEVNTLKERLAANKSDLSWEIGAIQDQTDDLKKEVFTKLDHIEGSWQAIDDGLSRDVEMLRGDVDDLKESETTAMELGKLREDIEHLKSSLSNKLDRLSEHVQTVDKNLSEEIEKIREDVEKSSAEVKEIKEDVDAADAKLNEKVEKLKEAGKTSEEEMSRKMMKLNKETEGQIEDLCQQIATKRDKFTEEVAFSVDFSRNDGGVLETQLICNVGNHCSPDDIPAFTSPVDGIYLSLLEVQEGNVDLRARKDSSCSFFTKEAIVQNKEEYKGRATYAGLIRLKKGEDLTWTASLTARFRWSLLLVQVF